LITTQTVDYWLWSCVDPLVAFLAGPANASCSLQVNHTAEPLSQIWTGKDDIKKVNEYVKWRGQEVITDFYAEPVKVKGCTDDGRFGLRIKEGDRLQIFDDSFYKTINLTQEGKATFRDIDVYKYVFENSLFDTSYAYSNGIQGFSNESAPNQGVPVFLSYWDFYYVNNSYGNISNMHPNKNDVSTILVEPFTGNTVKADIKVQVNLYVPPNDPDVWLSVFNFGNVTLDNFYPVLKAWQKSEVGDDDRNLLISRLKLLQPKTLNGLRFGIFGGGVLLLLIGIILVLHGKKLHRVDGYTHIQGKE